jgi:yecA family protein
MIYSVEYDDLAHSLISLHAATDAAEAQGLLCGILCAQGRVEQSSWTAQVLGESLAGGDISINELRQQLHALYEESMQSLYDEEFGFQMYLPDDDVTLQERIEAISEWCQGFLLGFSMRSLEEISGEIREEIEGLIEDFVEVTRLDVESGDDEGEDEQSFMEIEEYIRMGVIYIFTSLNPVSTSHRLQ